MEAGFGAGCGPRYLPTPFRQASDTNKRRQRTDAASKPKPPRPVGALNDRQQNARLTVELGDAAAALQAEKQKLEALRQSTDVLRAQQRAAWNQFDSNAANATTRSSPDAALPTTAGESADQTPTDDGVPDHAGTTEVGLAGNNSTSSQTEAAGRMGVAIVG